MLEKDKISLIADYLEFRFPMCEIETAHGSHLTDPKYRIDRGGKIDHLIISRDFIEDCAKETLLPALEQLDLYTLFSRAKGRKVFILNKGVRFE
jgi:hypothetical protein